MAIKIKAANKGLLHKKLGVKQGKKLTSTQTRIKPGDSTKLKREKQFAINARSWRKG
jgi:hypothetical protein